MSHCELTARPKRGEAANINRSEWTWVARRSESFPLSTGKTWEIRYTEQHPSKTFRSEEWLHKYTVVGFEPVEVPAGKFNALKIEAEGRWTAELEPTQTVVQGAEANSSGVSTVTQTQKTSDRTVSAIWRRVSCGSALMKSIAIRSVD